jgi:RNA-directed DNA polymerase
MTHDRGKSDSSVVLTKPPNKAGRLATEAGEGSGLAKGNPLERHDDRTQRRISPSTDIERIRQAARREQGQRVSALLHHVYGIDRLRAAYFALKRDAAAGIDGETWQHYGEALEDNLRDLAARLRRAASRTASGRSAALTRRSTR